MKTEPKIKMETLENFQKVKIEQIKPEIEKKKIIFSLLDFSAFLLFVLAFFIILNEYNTTSFILHIGPLFYFFYRIISNKWNLVVKVLLVFFISLAILFFSLLYLISI